MVNHCLVVLSLLAASDLIGQTFIANYGNDFNESGSPGHGWRYLWNAPEAWSVGNTGDLASGFIGAPDTYRDLLLVDSIYTADGDTVGGNNSPAGFLRLSATGGHPGIQDDGSNKRARYAIAAYTVPEDGLYAIENSFLSVTDSNSDGVEILVFPGRSEAVFQEISGPTETTSFDVEIGYFDAGQTIYVAFGPGETSSFDGFLMDFDIVRYDRISLKDQLLNGIASGEKTITIIPGRYFANESGTYVSVNNFNPSSTVTIVADGVELVNQSKSRILSFTNSSNIIICGLDIDYDPQLYRQGTVERVNNNILELRLHEGYPQTLSADATSGIIYDPANLRIKQLTDTFYPRAINEIEPGLYAITTAFRLPNLQVGDYASLTEPHSIPHTIYLENCSDMLFEDVEIHGAPAFALLSREAYKITLDNVRVIPGKTPLRATVQRLLSSNADGLHFKESHGEIHIKNCQLAFNGDDTIVLTSSYAPIIGNTNGNVITVAPKSKLEKPKQGDIVYVYNRNTGTREQTTIQSTTASPLSKTEIQSRVASLFPFARVTNSTFEEAHVLTLTSPVSASDGGWIANRGGESSAFSITNNSIQNTRARGILIKASNGVVRGNVIFNTLLPGIQVRPDAETWLEGDFAQNVLIEDNELRRCAIGRSNSFAPIYVSARGFDNWTPGSGHINLTIAHNLIFNAPGASILVQYSDDVQIRSNRYLTSHNLTNTSPWFNSVIRMENANNVSVLGVNLVMGINQQNANLSALISSGPKVTNTSIFANLLLDSDQDGLPDEWESLFFGDPMIASPSADPDGDGLTNSQEFLAQLNPIQADSFSATIEGGKTLRWTPRANRFITVHGSVSPSGPFSILETDIPAEAGLFTLPTLGQAKSMFYRLEISE